MPTQLTEWLDAVVRWGPAVSVAIVFAIALAEAVALPRRVWAKGIWVVAVLACGALAGGDLRLQQQRTQTVSQTAASDELAALHGLWGQWDAVSQTLPPAGEAATASFDTIQDALVSLSIQVAQIDRQIAALRLESKGRSIDDDTAAKLTDYLRQLGSFPVLVSCVPDDVEAYGYANQLVNILRAAGWDSHGPEISVVPGAAAMGVSVFVRDPRSPGAAKILLDAFTRFNIPFQSGVAASEAILDTATVELFVAKKP
ncbi:MAG TPA: hypothetical protein VGR70_14920 [Stellaceae bacterium]|nr:hypothetical protein [Stellaceae bacterium]